MTSSLVVTAALAAVVLIAGAAALPLLHDGKCRISTVQVQGTSMLPLIADGTNVEVISGGSQCAEPLDHRVIVVIRSDSHRLPLLKTLRGLPGDRFLASGGHLFLNDNLMTNSAGHPYELIPSAMAMLSMYAHDYAATIPANTYLVLGDNPEGSLDSTRFGLIARDMIIGRMVMPPLD